MNRYIHLIVNYSYNIYSYRLKLDDVVSYVQDSFFH